MGNSSRFKSSFEENNWRKIKNNGHRVILYNDITMKSIEQHQALLDMESGLIEDQCIWRSQLPHDSCIVDLYEFGIKGTGLCSGQSQLFAITERVHPLNQIGSFSKAEAFLIIRDTLHALAILYTKYKKFTPTLNIIGINSEGKTKMWVNQNFAKLSPEEEVIPVDESQLAIVNNLINLVSSKVYEDLNFPINYPRNINFKQSEKYIDEVLENLRGFKVDRVYLDRADFKIKYRQLREIQEKEERSRMIASEAERRLREIQFLHEKLRMQQQELKIRENQLRARNSHQKAESRPRRPSAQESPRVVLVSTSETLEKERQKQVKPTYRIDRPPLPAPPKPKIEKEIEMVDSMIVMQRESLLGEENIVYEESRIIRYKS